MNGTRLHLLEAYLAMLDRNVEKFKEFRSEILSDLLLHLVYEYDVKSEQDHQAKIEENDVGNVGEDPDEKTGDHLVNGELNRFRIIVLAGGQPTSINVADRPFNWYLFLPLTVS